MASTAIIYCVIARADTVLCSHSSGTGNFEEVAKSMLPNIPTRTDAKTTYTSNNYLFHVMVDNGIIYLCASNSDSGRRQPYAFLAEIKRQLTSGGLAHNLQFSPEHGLQSEFAPVLASQMERFSRPEGGEKITTLQSQVDEVRDIMTQNIESVLRRGENLETLMDKTTELEASSNTFRKTARRVHKKMWWKNTKMTIIIIAVVVVIILVVVLIILFSTGVLPVNSGGSDSKPVTTTAHP